jgi:hypothetical protein
VLSRKAAGFGMKRQKTPSRFHIASAQASRGSNALSPEEKCHPIQ